jgi:acetoin utilization deacetylase AcuC-like enzyme
MQIFHSDQFSIPLPEGHRFPMEKYALLRKRVENAGGDEIGVLKVPDPATDDELETVHDAEYVRKVATGRLSTSEIRRIGFPWSEALVERSRRSVGGTIAASRAALIHGLSVNLSGGTHHAFPDRGEGFCVFNDVAVAARVVQREGLAERIVILDLDVHQGNGTAAIFRDSEEVFTLSVHGANNYPFRKVPSDLDLELPDGAQDAEYLLTVEKGIRRALSNGPFDLGFFLAGADPHRGDRLGRLKVSKEGLKRRDHLTLSALRDAGIPAAVVMAGGYGLDIRDTVDIHVQTVRTAAEVAGT